MQSRRPFTIPDTRIALLLIGLVCTAASAAIWIGPGLINTRGGGDSPFLLIRVYELAANLHAGTFSARWMPDAAYGLGYPFFNFYASLPYYLAAALNLLGIDLITSIKLTQTAGMFAAGFGMYAFARTFFPLQERHPWASALAACGYVLAPFHLVNVYVRGDSLSEFWAFVWYPLILWAVRRVVETREKRLAPMLALAASLAALVLTHNVSALLFAPFIVVYALAELLHRRAPASAFVALMASAALAVALSAWFWLPALSEAPLAQLGEQTTGYFNYANHFRSGNLVQSSVVVNYAVNDTGDAFAMGLVQTALAALGAAVWWMRAVRAKTSRFAPALVLALFALATFMLTPWSAAIWENVPLLKLAQFPWRMLSVQAVFAAMLMGGLGSFDFRFSMFDGRNTNAARSFENPASARSDSTLPSRFAIQHSPFNILLVPLLSILLLVFAALSALPNDRLNIAPADVTPRTIQFYEWYTGNIGTTIRAEYLPASVKPRPFTGPALLGLPPQALVAQDDVAANAVTSQRIAQTPVSQLWHITSTQQTRVALPMLYAPGWSATLDGSPIDIAPYVGSGWISLTLPQGAHDIALRYTGTAAQNTGNTISTIAVLMGLAAGIVVLFQWPLHRRRNLALVVAATAIAVVLFGVAFRAPNDAPAMQAIDFQARPFPHRGPIVFVGSGQRYELVGASVTPAEVRAGEPFTLTLQWRDGHAPASVEITQEGPMGGEFAELFRIDRAVTQQTGTSGAHNTLGTALPGVQLLKLTAKDGGALLDARDPNGNSLSTLIGGKWTPGVTLMGPIVTAAKQPDAAPPLVTFDNGIALRRFDWFFASASQVCLRPQWQRASEAGNRADALQVSLRLRGSDGRLIAQADAQPQAGLAPTWSWADGALVYDSQCVPTNAPVGLLNAGEAYTIEIVWYRLATFEQTGQTTLRGVRGAEENGLNVPTK